MYPSRAVLRVNMNQAFGRAPTDVRAAVADWLRAGRRARAACRKLDDWIATIVPTLGPPRPPRIRLRGAHHDLGEIAAELYANEFRDVETARRPSAVTWGRRGRRSARRSLQLGSFDPETTIVRIHPVLDQPAVPRWFVRYVLFHELLHARLNEPCRSEGRAQHHGPAFRAHERAYPGTAPALSWQEDNLPALLRSVRSGKPMPVPAPRRKVALLQGLQGLLFR